MSSTAQTFEVTLPQLYVLSQAIAIQETINGLYARAAELEHQEDIISAEDCRNKARVKSGQLSKLLREASDATQAVWAAYTQWSKARTKPLPSPIDQP